MDSQGQRQAQWGGISFARLSAITRPQSPAKHLFARWLICLLLLGAQGVWAQSPPPADNYVYDAAGRLVAVTRSDGTTTQYTYDDMGNLLQKSASLPAGQLALFSFSPNHGNAGTVVTLNGQGFSSTLGNNGVSFNGTSATLQSATPTQLITSVPLGASTGPISVTVGGQTVTSAAPFTVDGTGAPPIITQVAPNIAATGATVTITGTGLNPVPGNTVTRLAGQQLVLQSAADTQLQFVVPSAAVTGHLTVQTPFGQTTSPTPLVVLPSAVSAANVVSSANIVVDGAPTALTIGTATQFGTVAFDATGNSWLSLQASAITGTAGSVKYVVYAPGNTVVQQGTFSSTSPSVHLPPLAAGTYLVTFQPSSGNAQFSVGVESNVALAPNTPVTVATAVQGQSKRVLVAAKAGQSFVFEVLSTTTNPSARSVTYSVYTPSGVLYVGSTSVSSTGAVNLSQLPETGVYQVLIAPGSGITGTVQVETVPSTTTALPSDDSSQAYTTQAAGQNAYLSFTAHDGDNLNLTLAGLTITGTTATQVYVNVYNAAGTNIASTYCYTGNPGGSCRLDMLNMVAGNYTAIVSPYSSASTMHFNAILALDTAGPQLVANTPASVTLAAGQVETFTFNANAGDTVALNLSSVTTTPTGQTLYAYVYRPDTGPIASNNYYSTVSSTGASTTLNLQNLPASGTYIVRVFNNYGIPSSAQLTLAPGVQGAVSAGGSAQNFATTLPGQNVYLSFSANAGSTPNLTLNGLTISGTTNTAVTLSIYGPTGTNLGSVNCSSTSPGGSCRISLWNPIGGTYTAVVTTPSNGTVHFNAILSPDTSGPVLTANQATNVALNAGQVERLTFNANAGDTVALTLSGLSTTPAGQTIYADVYRPDLGVATSTNAYKTVSGSSGTLTLNLPNLPANGSYTVRIYTAYGIPGSAQVTLVSGATGALLTNGTSQNYAATVANQSVYLSFNATAGSTLNLTLSGLTVSGSTSASVQVLTSNGGLLASSTCYTTNPGGSCRMPLWNLAAGTYSVVVAPTSGGTITGFNVMLVSDSTGPTLTAATPVTATLGTGQVERLTFQANIGDTVALTMSGASTTPSGQYVYADIYRPDTGALTSSVYSTFNSNGSSKVLNLPNLPATGTYTIRVYNTYGIPSTAQFSLTDTAAPPPVYGTPTLPSNGSPQSESSSAAGQNITMAFNANAGDNLNLTLAGLAITGSSSTSATVKVSNPSGAVIVTTSCYTTSPGSSCRIPLLNLVAGTYSVVVTPPNGSSNLNFNAILLADVIGPVLAANTPVAANLSAGQVTRLTFNANAGDNVALNLSGVSTTPTGQAVFADVYRPDTGAITTSNYYTTFNSSGSNATLNLQNLPASGTYTVRVYNSYGIPSNAQVTLAPSAAVPLPPGGTSQNYGTTTAGQNVYLSFAAQAGASLNLTLTGLTIGGTSSTQVNVNVYNAAGSNIASTSCYTTNPGNSCRLGMLGLVAGTYSVVVSPSSSGSTMQFNAMLAPDTSGPTLAANTPATVTLATGQVETLTFNANAGDTVALNLSGVTSTPAGQTLYAYIYRPDFGAITASNSYANFSSSGSNAILNLPSLPVSGTYIVRVFNSYGTPATAQLTLTPGATGTLPMDGASQSYASTVPGQNMYLSFSANPGDDAELTFTNVTSSFGAVVFNASGSQIGGVSCSASSPGASCTGSFWNLTGGTYSVVITPSNSSSVLQFKALLLRDTTGPALVLNTPASVSLGVGQVERLTFHANRGDSYTLNLAAASTVPSGQSVYVNVYRPDANPITTGNDYASANSSGTTTALNLASLPVSGNYTVVVSTNYGEAGAVQLTLLQGSTGALTLNTSHTYTTIVGQSANLTFNKANYTSNLELTINNLAISGSDEAWATLNVLTSSGAQVASTTCYAVDPGGSCRVPLWNLAPGNYTVSLVPANTSNAMTFNAVLASDVVGPDLTPNTPASVLLNAGQVERLTFTANAGDSVALKLSGVATTPPGQLVYVDVYRPDTTAITTSNYHAYIGSAGEDETLTLPNLPVSGVYTVVVSTTYGESGQAQLTLTTP